MESLRDQAGFAFWTFPDRGPEPLDRYVRLGLGGPPLSRDDAACGLLVLDGTWRLADRMEKFFRHVPSRSLSGIQSAYPRVSRIYADPREGLASIEAIYAAYRCLQRPHAGLLDDYYWAAEFLARNNWA